MRRALAGVIVAALLVVGAPAHAAEHRGAVAAPYADWGGAGFAVGAGHLSATLQAFLAACAADFLNGGSDARDSFLTSPANGYDAYVVDLGREVTGPFVVRGPGSSPFGPAIPAGILGAPIELRTYDLDLDFYTDVDNVCADANFVEDSSDPCFSSKPDPDESTPCIKGYASDDGVVHGARYVVVVASLNLTGGGLPFILQSP